jgi:hypothetical protein
MLPNASQKNKLFAVIEFDAHVTGDLFSYLHFNVFQMR